MKFELDPRAELRVPHRFILMAFFVVFVAGCAAMEGVNVGASIPIGGIVNVGANKTIGDGKAPAQSKKKKPDEQDESAPEEE